MGARFADPNGTGSAGESYVVYGGATAPGTIGVLNLSALDGTNGFRLNGIDGYDLSGRSVSSAGDVNGDGFDDLIVGAFRAAPNGNYSGESYVVYGGTSAPGTNGVLNLSALDGTNGFRLNGIDANDLSGYSVSSAGDVNGDGFDDLIVGAFAADPNGNGGAGESYVVFGGAVSPGTNGVFDLSALDGTNGFRLNGIDIGDISGRSVSSAGDVNGDGFDDLIVGAYRAGPNGNSRAGESYVIYGGASAPGTNGVLDLSMLDGTNGFRLNGINGDDYSGRSVSSAGDVNGDGFDDLIVGAYLGDPNGNNSGESYVVFGGADAPGTNGVLDLSALDGTNGFRLNGIGTDDGSGASVSSAGDVNGDGYDDLIVGAFGADSNGGDSGESYVVYGGASAPGTNGVLNLSALDGTNGFRLDGIDGFDRSGHSVSSAGDVNGDGYDDLIVGAYLGDPNGTGAAGESYVVYGGATGTESTTDVIASGTASADNFTGNAGNDVFTAISTGDVVRGGAGDDSVSVTSLDFADVDGGTGRDTLVLDGAGLSLDLTGSNSRWRERVRSHRPRHRRGHEQYSNLKRPVALPVDQRTRFGIGHARRAGRRGRHGRSGQRFPADRDSCGRRRELHPLRRRQRRGPCAGRHDCHQRADLHLGRVRHPGGEQRARRDRVRRRCGGRGRRRGELQPVGHGRAVLHGRQRDGRGHGQWCVRFRGACGPRHGQLYGGRQCVRPCRHGERRHQHDRPGGQRHGHGPA